MPTNIDLAPIVQQIVAGLPVISQGDQGRVVSIIQAVRNAGPTALYGPIDTGVTTQYQINNNLTQSGEVDADTWTSLLTGLPKSAPTVSSVSPNSGPAGTTVTITGTGFVNGPAVKFGTVSATVTSWVSSTELIATVPTGTGEVDVEVTAWGGTSAVSASDKFTYA